MERYAMLIRKTDLALLTFLNDGVEPPLKPKTYMVIELNGPNDISTKIVTWREFLNLGEISNISPLLLKLKK